MTQAAKHIFETAKAPTEKHTPGPWYISEGHEVICIRATDSDAIVASIDDGGHAEKTLIRWDQQEANARLIAAAPKLLEALKAIMIFAADDGVDYPTARTAIAEAEGR